MDNIQLLTMVLALATSFIAVLAGVPLNDARLGDIRDLVNRRVDDFKNLLEETRLTMLTDSHVLKSNE